MVSFNIDNISTSPKKERPQIQPSTKNQLGKSDIKLNENATKDVFEKVVIPELVIPKDNNPSPAAHFLPVGKKTALILTSALLVPKPHTMNQFSTTTSYVTDIIDQDLKEHFVMEVVTTESGNPQYDNVPFTAPMMCVEQNAPNVLPMPALPMNVNPSMTTQSPTTDSIATDIIKKSPNEEVFMNVVKSESVNPLNYKLNFTAPILHVGKKAPILPSATMIPGNIEPSTQPFSTGNTDLTLNKTGRNSLNKDFVTLEARIPKKSNISSAGPMNAASVLLSAPILSVDVKPSMMNQCATIDSKVTDVIEKVDVLVEAVKTEFGKPAYAKLPFTAPTLPIGKKAPILPSAPVLPVKVKPSTTNQFATTDSKATAVIGKDLKEDLVGEVVPTESVKPQYTKLHLTTPTLPVGKKAPILPSAPVLPVKVKVKPSTMNQSATNDSKVKDVIDNDTKEDVVVDLVPTDSENPQYDKLRYTAPTLPVEKKAPILPSAPILPGKLQPYTMLSLSTATTDLKLNGTNGSNRKEELEKVVTPEIEMQKNTNQASGAPMLPVEVKEVRSSTMNQSETTDSKVKDVIDKDPKGDVVEEVATTESAKPQYAKLPFTASTLLIGKKAPVLPSGPILPGKIQPSTTTSLSNATTDMKLNKTSCNNPKEELEKLVTPESVIPKNANQASAAPMLPFGKKAPILPSAPMLPVKVKPSTMNQSATTDSKVNAGIDNLSKEDIVLEVVPMDSGKAQCTKLPFTAPTLPVGKKAPILLSKTQPSTTTSLSNATTDMKLNKTSCNIQKEDIAELLTPEAGKPIHPIVPYSAPVLSFGKKAPVLPSAPIFAGKIDTSTTIQSATTDLKFNDSLKKDPKEVVVEVATPETAKAKHLNAAPMLPVGKKAPILPSAPMLPSKVQPSTTKLPSTPASSLTETSCNSTSTCVLQGMDVESTNSKPLSLAPVLPAGKKQPGLPSAPILSATLSKAPTLARPAPVLPAPQLKPNQ
jgi:hypothetical protein